MEAAHDFFTGHDNGMPDFKIFHSEGKKNFGHISRTLRTKEQEHLNEDLINAMPLFKIFGSVSGPSPKKVCLWDFKRQVNNGKDFWRFYQKKGSCVGNGFGQALWTLQAIESVNGDGEEVKLPFWLFTYGMSRMLGGMHNYGEGSFGSAIAQAATKYGDFHAYVDGVPQPQLEDDDTSVTWGGQAEWDWSNGDKIGQKYVDLAKPHLIKTVSLCKTADDVRTSIINGYPCTCASDWGGDMRPRVAGTKDPVILNHRTDTWQHQMSIDGWWEHPELGEIFYIANSWGTQAHGKCPSGAPLGGFWIKKADMDYICRQNEVFAYSQYDGYPAQKLDDMLFKIFNK